MYNCPESNNYEHELIESDYLPFISFEKFLVVVVGGCWVSYDFTISSAPLSLLSFEILTLDTDQNLT